MIQDEPLNPVIELGILINLYITKNNLCDFKGSCDFFTGFLKKEGKKHLRRGDNEHVSP